MKNLLIGLVALMATVAFANEGGGTTATEAAPTEHKADHGTKKSKKMKKEKMKEHKAAKEEAPTTPAPTAPAPTPAPGH